MKITRREAESQEGLLEIADPVLRRLLRNRGIATLSEARPELRDLLHFNTLPDIAAAARTLADAVEQGRRILVFGDYDVDGMTGAALGVRGLKALGVAPDAVSCKVPSRYDGGYGLTSAEVKLACEAGYDLILTVDNGITCLEAAASAKEQGITLVITDHHECSSAGLPEAAAVVDPKRPDSSFPSQALCGAGVLFYVLCAVRAELDSRGFYATRQKPAMDEFLDLVTLGTVGDVVAFDPNNRRLVKAGIRRMRRGCRNVGIRALAEQCRCDLEAIDPHGIGFDLCPKLNAAGRIRLPDNPALDLLLTDDPAEARRLALRLDMCNRRRGDFERAFLKEAREDAARHDVREEGVLVLFREHWLSGIAGLLAGRLKSEYGVPCFVFTGDGDELKGSARSVPGVPLGEILNLMSVEHPGLLLQGGGHAMAAGATIARESLAEFSALFSEYARRFGGEIIENEMVTDGELPPECVTLDFARQLEDFGPFGEGFPEPLFDGVFEITSIYPIQNRHLRFTLKTPAGQVVQAIRFRALVKEKALRAGMRVQAVYALDVNRYQGAERLQVRLESIEPL